ncbi:MAG TPA: monofunctional biosynthetic peptidoglycan transglycosylase [Desulfobacteraceae bacterium]|nr:monofunctional biosynthetic peptidoglycan transglycosylase [Desulfobacteraceae bacterium]
MGKSKKKTFGGWLIRTVLKCILALVFLTCLQVLTFKFVNPPGTVNMVYEWTMGRFFEAPYVPSAYHWNDMDDISPHLRRAVLASEDQRFLTHHGFDFTEIRNVIDDMMENKGFRGASTISMQAARSLYLPASRTVYRKAAEAWYTILIELFWDKKRILEIYLNTVDWGTGIVGAQAGARAYFSRDAATLTAPQAALMAAVLPSPHKWSAKKPGPYVKKRQKRILAQMKAMPVL